MGASLISLPLVSICSYRLFKELWVDNFIWLRPDFPLEPPSADPHARWCGGRGRKTPGYPIRRFITRRLIAPKANIVLTDLAD